MSAEEWQISGFGCLLCFVGGFVGGLLMFALGCSAGMSIDVSSEEASPQYADEYFGCFEHRDHVCIYTSYPNGPPHYGGLQCFHEPEGCSDRQQAR